ncbi:MULTISPECIES: MFS transporter permease [Alteromonadaceae]|uniref:MFS transporter permease n=1 Tax=Brumicola blandensis TaxID=3075611 RepID=A0AAW8R0F5_9ALTE|nr:MULTISPECIES: MFS transporter permease [unclassified Alteromonas]MDT0581325.1 MFS transporter permease [Alteromonas sp. W409]MDT0626953.1 MFS transporter permease [Alteromonas sp. W364]
MQVKWRIVASLLLSKLVDILLSAKTTLPTFLTNLGAPSWMLGLLVPIRESGALLPQGLFSQYLSSRAKRHRLWLGSMMMQTLFILLMIVGPMLGQQSEGALSNTTILGAIVLACLAGLSISRALTSLTMKDIQGQHIDKGKRGDLVGIASTLAGLLSLGFAFTSLFSQKLNNDIILSIGIISILAMLFATAVMVGVKTTVEVDTSEQNNKQEAGSKPIALLKSVCEAFKGSLGRFILVRSCFVHTALLAPFFVVWCTSLNLQSQWLSLSLFIVAQASAAILSSYAWGRLSDSNAKLTMQLGASIVLTVLVTVVLLTYFEQAANISPHWYVLLYFCLSLGHEGARAGRKVYALDIKQGSERTNFIGQANSAIGVVLLALGLFYSALSVAGTFWVFTVMALGLVAGLFASLQLKKEK